MIEWSLLTFAAETKVTFLQLHLETKKNLQSFKLGSNEVGLHVQAAHGSLRTPAPLLKLPPPPLPLRAERGRGVEVG